MMKHVFSAVAPFMAPLRAPILSLAVALAAALPAAGQIPGGQTTGGQTTGGAPVAVDILPGWVKPDGTRVAALRFALAPGWKTYWRAPGDAGIPPRFDWSRSDNLRGVAITWPAPHVFDQGGMRSIGYKDQLILPLTLAPARAGQPVELDATLEFGVCSDICVPQEVRLRARLDGADTTPSPAIAAALASRAYAGSEAGLRAATCALRPNGRGLEIVARLTLPPVGAQEEVVVIEPGQPGLWMSETQSHRQGGTLIARGQIAADGGALALDRSAVTITVLGDDRAVEIKGCTRGEP